MSSCERDAACLAHRTFRTFFLRHVHDLPCAYSGLCSNRMTLLYFCVASLDLLDATACVDAHAICQWVLAQQVSSKFNPAKKCGFRGSPSNGLVFDPSATIEQSNDYDEGHIAMTYSALALLIILGNDLHDVDKQGIIAGLRHLQQKNGGFSSVYHDTETDTRFVFCACAIATFLNDWSSIDKDKATVYILSCQSYDGAFGLRPGGEGHGGSTFCAVSALHLMGSLDHMSAFKRGMLLKWCIMRQGEGYSGRPNKPEDCCYSYWIGATIKLLDAQRFTCPRGNRQFNFKCISSLGGFGKVPGVPPDLLHAFCGTAGLSLMEQDSLLPISAALGISQRALRSFSLPEEQVQNQ